MPKVVHFEIPVDDPERASAFHRDALGGEITGIGDQPYWLVQAGADDEPGANGALIARGTLHTSPELIAGVADIDETLAVVPRAGGRVVHGKLSVPGVGWSAYVLGSEGNTIGFFQSDPSVAPGS
jgi:predicted enzyme related to lactoylglutathione lyase